MSRYNHKRKWTIRDYTVRVACVILSTIVLVALMPRESLHFYSYEKGHPWDHSTLIAEDSFPVFKSEERQKQEEDSIMKMFEPYFQKSGAIGDSMISQWHAAFVGELKGSVPREVEHFVTSRLTEIYIHGVMSAEAMHDVMKQKISIVRIIQGNISSKHELNDVFSPKTAYEYILGIADSSKISRQDLVRCNLNRFIISNLTIDTDKNQQLKEELISYLTPYLDHVVAGQKIVDRGQIVDEHTYCVLQSLDKFLKERTRSTSEIVTSLIGQIVFTLLCLSLLLVYFQQFRNDYLTDWRSMLLVAVLFLVFPLMTYGLSHVTVVSAYILPFCITPIFIRVFMDSRTAFLVHFMSILMSSIAVSHPEDFIIIESLAGLTSIVSLRELSQRSDLFRSVLLVLVVTIVTYACTQFYSGDALSMSDFNHRDVICLTVSSLLLLMSYLLLIPIEKLFGFTSSVTLIELSNTNNKLLRRMSEEAPGTFQHSMQVANLCVAVAEKIGAKAQLVRTGALYHDIGKIRHAVFFTENQNGINPHDRLTYEQSAQIIISHVREGIALAEKNQLPQNVIDFIATHHGKSLTKYFYVQAQNKNPEEKIDPSMFQYPGPNPKTREQVILTMCDAVEAASRSVKEITEENFSKLVDNIIDSQLRDGMFCEAPITFQDIAKAKEVLKEKLMTIYHTRIQYPELKK